MYVDLHGAIIEITLMHMKEYLDIVSSSIENKQKEFDEFIEKEVRKIDPDDRDPFYEHYSDDYWRLNEVFPVFLYKSFIVSWYSFVENELFMFCNILERENDLILSHKDLSDRGITQARKYLVKVAAIDLVQVHWNELINIGKIRNVIVHRDGDFTDAEIKDLKQYFDEHNLIENSRTNKFLPHLQYCRHLIELADNFFKNLYFDGGKTTSRSTYEKKRGK